MFDLYFTIEMQPVEIGAVSSEFSCSSLLSLSPSKIFEEVKIGKQRGEVLAIVISVLVSNQVIIDADLAARRNVETGQQFYECGFAAAVSARDPDRFAGVQSESIGPRMKSLSSWSR